MANKFTLKQLQNSRELSEFKDALPLVLEQGEVYSKEEAKQKLDELLNKEVS